MQYNGSVIYLISLALLCGCSSTKELTRSKAAKLIQDNIKFPKDIISNYQIGESNVPAKTLEAAFALNDNSRYSRLLVVNGLETIEWKGTGNYYGTPFGIVLTNLTDKGRRYLAPAQVGAVITKGARNVAIKMCELQFDGVTGITPLSDTADGGTRVEYKWRIINKTPFQNLREDIFPSEQSSCSPNGLTQGAVVMRLYDDGWRFEGTTFFR